jgi:hypothetical protein
MGLLTKRFARAATLAAAIVASSASFATGRPVFGALGDVAFKLTAGFSEVEQVRRKISRRAFHFACARSRLRTRDIQRAIAFYTQQPGAR